MRSTHGTKPQKYSDSFKQTNVAYYERSARGDNANNFVSWTPAGNVNPWVTIGDTFNGAPPQRYALYPNQIPQAAGIPNSVRMALETPIAHDGSGS